jgi:hypothetical protein
MHTNNDELEEQDLMLLLLLLLFKRNYLVLTNLPPRGLRDK